MRRQATLRIRCIALAVLCVFLILLGRLYQLQILNGQTYREMAENQYVHTVRDLYNRGSIYLTTKDGEKVSAATIKTGYLLAIDPSHIVNADETYNTLSSFLSIDKEFFLTRASKKDKTYQEIVQQVDEDVAQKIKAMNITGVHLYRNQWRYYPGKSLAARTIGFVGYDETSLVGKYGLERYYEDRLARNNEHLSVNFFAELFGNFGDISFNASDDAQADIVTTIEPTVARALDKVLLEANDRWKSNLTGGIIINPKNGEIIALNVVPSYDLNDRSGVPLEDFVNPLVENVYEMGSIIKPLTVASGLDAGVIRPESTYYDAGFLTLNERTIRNYDGKGRGTVSMQEVLNQSLNTGVAHISKLLGRERFRHYFTELGLGERSGIDLPNEGHGLIKHLEKNIDVEFATASFGQGIALTPIATVRALSSLANGGTLITPHLVKRIEYKNGKGEDVSHPEGRRVFSEKTSEEITSMLVKVVDTALKGGKAKNEYYTIAAKTGTAQIVDPQTGKYYDDRYLHSFFGYFPAYDPQFLVFLYTVEPKGVKYASETLTDPFMELSKFLINYYALPPDR